MNKIKSKFKYFIAFLQITITVFISNEIISKVNGETDSLHEDAIVIEAPLRRDQKQIHFYHPYWAAALSEGNPCLTSKGSLGFCASFRHCYPYIKFPDVTLWESWILGNYDTCTYFNPEGRQLLGVCCTKSPLQPLPPTTNATQTDGNKIEENANDVTNGQSKDTLFQNWPPPIPTFPPSTTTTKRPVSIMQWPPPVPTHPPDHHYPTHPTHQPTAIVTSTVTTTTAATNRPSTIAWPPPIPTHSPTSTTSRPEYSQASCGTKGVNLMDSDQERIVGGQNAVPHEYPWVAVLFNGGKQFCGGSLIDESHVLTAAHCVAHMTSWDVARLTVHLGDHNIRSTSEVRHVERKVKRLVRHKGFDFRTLYNDVALLMLDKPVKFSKAISTICLPSGSSKAYSGKIGTVAGWGSLRENGPQPAILQKVSIPIWTNNECSRKYGSAAPAGIIESMICAGQAARDSCSGDSGGPLMIMDGSRWVQAGIVSWGIGCGKGQYPGVYTRVSSFLPWIKKNLNTK